MKIQTDDQNIFEIIEKKGFKVGLISAMNIFNNLKNPDYFIPDPWTETISDNDIWSKVLSKSISAMVKDNARKKIDIKNLFYFLLFSSDLLRLKIISIILLFFLKVLKKKWFRSLFLDLFLHDFHMNKLKKKKLILQIFFLIQLHIYSIIIFLIL